MDLPAPFLQLLERALNNSLADSLRARELYKTLKGKTCAIELRDWQTTFYLIPNEEQLRLSTQLTDSQQADVSISGTLPIMARTALGQHPQGLTINGDAALAQSFQQLLREAEFDWEGNLARYIGPLPAHQLSRAAGVFLSWGQQAGEALQATVQQYMQEENALLPRRAAVRQFSHQVDELRDALDRLEARLNRMEKQT